MPYRIIYSKCLPYLMQFLYLIWVVCMLLQLQNIWARQFFFIPAPARVSTHINKKEIKSSTELGKRRTQPAMKLKGAIWQVLSCKQAWEGFNSYDKCQWWHLTWTQHMHTFQRGATQDLTQIEKKKKRKSSQRISFSSSINSQANQDELVL